MNTVMNKESAISAMKTSYRLYDIKPFVHYTWETKSGFGFVQFPLPNLKLRNIRELLFVSQDELETLIGLDKRYLWEIEDSHLEFTIDKQELISNWFGFRSNIFQMDLDGIIDELDHWTNH